MIVLSFALALVLALIAEFFSLGNYLDLFLFA